MWIFISSDPKYKIKVPKKVLSSGDPPQFNLSFSDFQDLNLPLIDRISLSIIFILLINSIVIFIFYNNDLKLYIKYQLYYNIRFLNFSYKHRILYIKLILIFLILKVIEDIQFIYIDKVIEEFLIIHQSNPEFYFFIFFSIIRIPFILYLTFSFHYLIYEFINFTKNYIDFNQFFNNIKNNKIINPIEKILCYKVYPLLCTFFKLKKSTKYNEY